MTIDGVYYTGRDRDYGYDSRGQLTSVVETIPTPFTVTTQTYAYDKNGNRTATNGVAATIGANNRLTNDGTYSYTYDDEGNLLSRTTIATGARQEYAWDHRNRLAAVVHRPSVGATPTLVEINAYDVFDRRVRRDLDTTGDLNPESRELYVYDGDDVLLDFTDSDANGAALPALARRYLHGPAVDQVLAQENVGGETYWLLGDHMNSTHDLVRWEAGTGRTVVAGHQVYDAFGTPVDQAYLTRYQFTGREYDAATGQQYNRARWYSPHAGRWMSEDPIGFAAGDANLNRYVGNAPTNATDPSGRIAIPPEQEKQWRDRLSWLPRWAQDIVLEIGAPGPGATGKVGAKLGGRFAQKCLSQIHHLATNKNWVSAVRGGPWSPRFEKLFAKAGMTLDDAANKTLLPGHKGPHPERVHQIVFDRLQQATDGLPEGAAYRDALNRALTELGNEATTCGTELHKLLTGG